MHLQELSRFFRSEFRLGSAIFGISDLDFLKNEYWMSFFMEIRADFFLNGIWDSGGFRRVGSGVRIRKLLTRASGTLLASRLRRDKILDFERQM